MWPSTEPTNKCPGYDTKQSDGQALALEIWEMGSIPSLPLFPGPEVVEMDRVLSKGQIELFV